MGDGWVTNNRRNRRNRSTWKTRSGGFVLVRYLSFPSFRLREGSTLLANAVIGIEIEFIES